MIYKLGSKGAKLITGFERLRLESYSDVAGIWTIGFGNTTLNGYPVAAGMIINEPVAWALFYGSIQDYLDFIGKIIRIDLNQNQVDALCSFTYNLGKSALAHSGLLTAINSKFIVNEELFTIWNKARIDGRLTPLDGLTRRREAEFDLFMSKEGL
jgi:lysozyme